MQIPNDIELKDVTIVAELSNWGIIHVQGEKARHFLQGQLTQDLNLIHPSQGHIAGYLTPKGRVIANFFIISTNNTDIKLILPRELVPIVLSKLSKIALLSKVLLTDVSHQYQLFGLVHPALSFNPWESGSWDDAQLLRIDHTDLHILLKAHDTPTAILETNIHSANKADTTAIDRFLIESRIPIITLNTSEFFTIHELNLQTLAVSFTKGCYTGQEIVARTEYRATLKQHLYCITTTIKLQNAEMLYDAMGNIVGRIVNLVNDKAHSLCLVSMKDTQYEQKHCYLKRDDAFMLCEFL
jgi:tRNA-modifying protein YgfZ